MKSPMPLPDADPIAKAELVPFGDRELVVGDIRATTNGRNAPTVLAYGHFDVQPPAPLDEWESPPFELDIREGWAYGRGIADDKGLLYTVLKAAELLVHKFFPMDIILI
jgi:acetylornithine deacetylase/succinyl-diaminopimelate desuccinylase-like protein